MELLRTKRLILRRFEESDFAPLRAMMADAETMRFTGFKTPQPIERVRELLKKWHTEGSAQTGVWAVVASSTTEFIGWSMLKPTTSDTPELGYMLAKEHWGHGYASELAAALLAHAGHTLKLKKVIAVTSAENFASVRVLEKSGMSRTDAAGDGIHFAKEFG